MVQSLMPERTERSPPRLADLGCGAGRHSLNAAALGVLVTAVIGIKGNAYFEAAHAIGSPLWRTLLRHVWPNITAPIIIIYSITIGWAIIAEASLSFLGFGLPPDVPSWGTMLSREGRQYMEMAPRLRCGRGWR